MNKYACITMMVMMSLSLSSCEVIGGIFKAGVWTGIIGIVLVVALIIFLISKMTKK